MKDYINDKITVFFAVIRAYSLPISFTSWIVAFIFSFLSGGNVKYGLIALAGILFLHAATNLFDDIIDFLRARHDIQTGKKQDFDFQDAKCIYLRTGRHNIRQYFLLLFLLCTVPFISGIYFYGIYGFKLLYIIIPTFILCSLYPILGCLGLGEILVALIFSPFLYCGVNFVMTGGFSFELFMISVSTGLLAVAVLHNHMLLDFNYDENNRKTTLCRLCATKERALFLLGLIISGAYGSMLFFVLITGTHFLYLLVFLSLPSAVTLYNVMKIHIKSPEEKIKYNIFMGNVSEVEKLPENQRGFLLKFLIVRNLMNSYIFYLCIAMIAECILLKNS